MTYHGKLRRLSASALRIRLSVGGELDRLLPASPDERLRMIEEKQQADAGLRYLSYALPEREAVWWACMCIRHVAPPSMPDGDAAAIRAAEQWVRKPGAVTRQAMVTVLREADAEGAAAFALRGALTSDPARPDNLGAGLSISQSVLRASGVSAEQDRASVRQRFRASALDIAAGGAGWIETGASAPTGGESSQP